MYKNCKNWWFLRRRNESLAVFLSVLKASQMLLVSGLLISSQNTKDLNVVGVVQQTDSRLWNRSQADILWSTLFNELLGNQTNMEGIGPIIHFTLWYLRIFYQKIAKKGKCLQHELQTKELKWRTAAACSWFYDCRLVWQIWQISFDRHVSEVLLIQISQLHHYSLLLGFYGHLNRLSVNTNKSITSVQVAKKDRGRWEDEIFPTHI